MSDSDDLVKVHEGSGGAGLPETIQTLLANDGIEAMIKTDSQIAAAPLGLPNPSFSIWVSPRDAHKAVEILREVEPHDPGTSDEYRGMNRGLAGRESSPTAPVLVIGGVAVLLLIGAVIDLSRGGVLWWMLLGLALLAAIAAVASRE